jgi:hypothetical protein
VDRYGGANQYNEYGQEHPADAEKTVQVNPARSDQPDLNQK